MKIVDSRPLVILHFVDYPACGRAGGVALLWKDQYNFDVLIKDKSFFHCVVSDNPNGDLWFVTFIRGPPILY